MMNRWIGMGLLGGLTAMVTSGREGAWQPEPGVSVQRFVEIPEEAAVSKAKSVVPEGVVAHENLVFGTGGGRELKLDLYVPSGDGARPAVMLVHGGGWTGGNKESFRPMAQALAAKGWVAATVEYRLATESRFPGAVEDCKAAVRWLRANAGRHGIDPDRIGAVGGSAGGHLVGMVATTSEPAQFEGEGGHAEQSSALQAAVLMGAGVDQATRAKEAPKPIQNQLIFFDGPFSKQQALYEAGSPITHVSAETPPLMFLEGEFDRPGLRYIQMREKLDALGVPNRLVVVERGKHGCWGSHPWMPAMVEEITSFLETHLMAE